MTNVADVAVVGAGPAGATAALLLANYGVRCTVLERRHSPQTHPAANVLSTRSMEIWRHLGLESDIRRLSTPPEEERCILYCTTLTGPELGRVPLRDLSQVQQDEIESLSPTSIALLPQNHLEPLLWARLQSCERIDFRPGWTYNGHTEDTDGITVTLRDTTTASSTTLRARYLIAADGAASAVRRTLNVTMSGQILQHMASVHFSADLAPYLRGRGAPVVWTHTPKGLGTIIVHRPPEDVVFQIPYFPPFQTLDDFPPEVCRRHIADAIGDPDIKIAIKSVQSWLMTAQVASAYRVGRAFLAGDAAHRFPPTGGFGLNTGIADVHNLAWKLAWVLTGRADAALLDTYEQERRPVGVFATANSVKNFDGLLDVLAVLGVPHRVVRRLPEVLAALPGWIPRRLARTMLRVGTALGYQRLRLPSSPGARGRLIRQRAASVIARQGPHYRSWGLDLGVRYHSGAVVADHLPAPTTDPEFYTPCVRAGGRLPHAWIDERERRVSTLDLIGDNELTLLLSESSRPAWEIAAADLPVRLKVLGDIHRQVLSTRVPGADPDALLVRPDGHIAALLRSVADDAPALRSALRAVKVPLPECDTEIADLPHRS